MAFALKSYVSPAGVATPTAYCRIARVIEHDGGRRGEALVEIHASEAARRDGLAPLEHWSFRFAKDAEAASWPQAYDALQGNPFADQLPADDADLADEAPPAIPDDADLAAGITDKADEAEREAIITERRARFKRDQSDAEERNAYRAKERAARRERRAMFAKAKSV